MDIDQLSPLFAKAAQPHNVKPIIHPDDYIFQFILNHPSHLEHPESAIGYYYSDGATSANNLLALLTDICGINNRPFSLLEFASGYGCVTRHIKNIIPQCSVTSCDIHPEAMTFLKEHFNVETLLSQSQPEQFITTQEFDVVFALSFFSHMPKSSFSRWLDRLASLVVPGGFLIFTTHGLVSRKLCFTDVIFDQDGFYFLPLSEQKDLNPKEYGSSVVLPHYVLHAAKEHENLSLKYFQEGYWWAHQDVYIFEKKVNHDFHGNSSIVKDLKNEISLKLLYLRWKANTIFR